MSNQSTNPSSSEHTNGLTISAENLGKRFNREWVFKSFSHQFTPGNVYAVTGPNGSGKSTLLHVLWGQMPPTSGTLLYSTNASEIQADDVYQQVAICAPYMDLIDEFTLQEQINFHFKLKQTHNLFSPDHLLEITYLTAYRDKYIGNFSSGMKQRLKLGLAFYTKANVIFLDEPGTNLDKQAINWYQEQLLKMSPDCTIIIASNNEQEYPGNAKIINLMDYKH